MQTTTTETASVLVIVPNHAPEDRQVQVGTTVGQLAGELGLDGSAQAFGAMNEVLSPDHEITAETEVINYVVRLAGAVA